MSSNEPFTRSKTTNKHSIISLILGILTMLVFCGSIVIPIPLTSFICAPVSALIGLGALIYGFVSLQKIKQNDETGHPMAWTGILIGGFVLLCLLCMIVAIASLFYFSPGTIPVPEFIQKFQF